MKKKVFLFILFMILTSIVTYFVYQRYSIKEEPNKDAIKFSKEYNLEDKKNVFVYKTADEIIKIMEKGTGIVYLGFPECKWCTAYVKILNEVAKEESIEKIYYYNILEDRKNNTENYQKMVAILKDHLQFDNDGNERIYVPNVSFHISGEIIENDYETSKDTKDLKDPQEYWTEEEVNDLKEKLRPALKQIFDKLNKCTDCNK